LAISSIYVVEWCKWNPFGCILANAAINKSKCTRGLSTCMDVLLRSINSVHF
jgi:hypothetical protein